MRVAIVAESFLPNVNGVTNSVLRVLEHLKRTGHDAIVVAPGARDGQEEIPDYLGFPIHRVPTVKIPKIDSLPIGVPTTAVDEAIRTFKPDIVHLASPFVLGAAGALVARQQRVPAVAIYQTDIAGFATKYSATALANAAWEWVRTMHNSCQLTLAPSSATIKDLHDHNVRNVHRWGRGVDAQLFHPSKRSPQLREQWGVAASTEIGAQASNQADSRQSNQAASPQSNQAASPQSNPPKYAVGFVGRLAAEKGVHRLASLVGRDDIQLVIVGDGPERPLLEAQLPGAIFMGALDGEDLARAYASLDVFIHAGEFETFCQTIQEAQASGVPTIGPRAGGPVDLIQDGHNGLLLDVDTFIDDLPRAVEVLLNQEIHQELRHNARASIADKTWESLCQQLLEHYEQVLESVREVPLTFIGQRPELPRWATRALGGRVA
ncbi:GDP-mannose-dependent alpha-mannosyltransferase [Corynebacterium phocae]|uniref:GDP-mannose-dependent alpha-mannosyltransferase n=1 Tax=Corynebacterium phocae TaxID=161895 RepID=A0A1L7D1K9_9CORY|nr:glycosyltransferase family 1 protein [Corynebacterium phocae]APT91851.1 GDP-mannose-dependent alpha-mannosyltransferase [Corynebacterium phocae]